MMTTAITLPSFDEILAAKVRLKGIAVRTPLIKLNYPMENIEIYLKCEQFQPISSFKIRAAGNIVNYLPEVEKRNGIVTASAGNMAQGLAWMAKCQNLICRVLVPDTANQVKIKAIERLGAEVRKCTWDEWWKVIITHQCPMLEGYFIHPVCNRQVIAGNATIGLEILEDLPDCDAIIVPYGGGAMICGIATAAKHLKSSIDVFASEIETAAPLAAAFEHGEVTKISMSKSWVDGIGSGSVLNEMWPLVQSCVDSSIVVTLKETAAALKLLIENNHFICEGASATSLAAALWHYENQVNLGRAALRRTDSSDRPLKIVAVLSGGGIDNDTIIKCLQDSL